MIVSTNGSATIDHPEQTTTTPPPRARTFSNYLDEFGAWAEENHRREKSALARGPIMPDFPKLAKAIGGHLMPGAHYLNGAPDVGKTALANQLASLCGCPALVVTTEMDLRELFLRQIARVKRRPLGELKSGTIPGSEMRHLGKTTAEAVSQVCVLDATCSAVSLVDVQRELRDLKNKEGDHVLMVLDSLHSFARRTLPGLQEYERVTRVSADLEQLVNAEKVAALIIVERNRASMQSGGLNSAKGSSSIEYTGMSVWSLDNADKDSDGKAIRNKDGSINITLTIEKNKGGPNNVKIDFAFFSALMNFIEQ